MKKILNLIIVVILIMSITGCNSKVVEEQKITEITTIKDVIEIEDGKVLIPEIKRIIMKNDDTKTEEAIDISLLKFYNSNNEELKIEDGSIIVPNEDDTITIKYIEVEKEFTTTINIKAEKKYITFGSSTLYFGKYKAEGDLPSDFNGIITINKDNTATYTGSKYVDGKIINASLTGTWEVREKSVGGLMGPPDNPIKVDGILFTWNDGTSNTYGVSDKYFGNQFMGYRWISK